MKSELSPKITEQAALLDGLQRKPTNSVVLLYSAGADSTASGLKLAEKGYSIHPIYFDYGHTATKAEEYLATTSPEKLGFADTKVIRMADVMLSLTKSSLLGGAAKDDKAAWVPARNSIFMMLAGVYAYQIDADGIAVGFMLEDQGVFGDSSIIHHKIEEMLLTQTLSRPMSVFTPLMSMTKKEVLKYLLDKRSLHLTVSCWNAQFNKGSVTSCHECANCNERDANLRIILKELKKEASPEEYEYIHSAIET